MDVQFPVVATASAIELVSAAFLCVNVKKAAKIAPYRNFSDGDGVFCCLGLTVTYDYLVDRKLYSPMIVSCLCI